MRSALRSAVMATTLLVTAGHASAQERPAISLSPGEPSRWDVAGHLGWFGSRSDVVTSPAYPYSRDDDWYEAGSFTVSSGYYLTPHLKLELEASATSEGESYSFEAINLPGEVYPFSRTRRYRIRSTGIAGGLTYQFFENRWFHPFVGGGIELVRRRLEADPTQQGPPPRNPLTPTIPALPGSTTVTYMGRPFVGGGFKVYGTEHVFVRTDLRFTLASEGARSVVWRGGVGVDF